MRILVTGGAGYLGSIAVEMLLEKGFEVSVLDDFTTGHDDLLPPQVNLIRGSILDPIAITASLDGCQAVMHFAGKSLVGESMQKPELYQSINVAGTRNLLDQMKKKGIKKIIFSSSAAVYGEPQRIPISEEDATEPTNPYGDTKLTIDNMLTLESSLGELSAVSLRYFNVAGSLKTARGWLAERHDPETHLIPNVLQSNLQNPVQIFGTDWPTPDGTCIRDYVHAIDIIEAHILALASLDKPRHDIFNLGSGVGYSIRQVLAAASEVKGFDIPFTNSPRREGDPAKLVADISKVKRVLGWSPNRNLELMVSDAWESRSKLD